MKESSYAFFFLDDHAEGAVLPAGAVQLKGWAVAKPGFFLTDLRVLRTDQTFPACYGHPRPDLAQHFKAREPFLLAGFEVALTLAAGDNRLEFEACEISGKWQPLAVVNLVGTPGTSSAPAAPSDPIPPHEFARALRLVLQGALNHPIRETATVVAALLPVPHVTRYAAVPFHGHLHNPPRLQRTEFGRVVVEGWLFHETQKILRIAASVDLQAWQYLEQKGAFPYVAGLFPQFPQAAACRFHGPIDVPAQLPQPLSLRLYAELDDGSWHLCHVERTHLYGDEQAKAPYVPGGLRVFVSCVRALRDACLARQLAAPVDRGFFRALREVWSEYRARALPRLDALRIKSAEIETAGGTMPGVVVLVTHNLNFEGAPLFLLEYGTYLARFGVKPFVVSAHDGPLRASFELIGASVEIVNVKPLLKARDARRLRSELRTLARSVNLNAAGLVVANTLSAYWGVHVARLGGKPSLFYLHESTTPDCFYYGYMAPATLPVVKETFALASHVSFLTDATRRYYAPQLNRLNHSVNPGWIDLTRIDQFRAKHSRTSLRERLGFKSSARLVVNVGTVCNRKGQHIFARAVDLLWRRHPDLAGQCEFLMVGARDSAYDRAVASVVEQLNRSNLRLVGETATAHNYFGAADLFVCSSYEESFPRVLLEAMAFSVPIVSTNVHGVPEMARLDQEAVLVPPGDSSALADAMARLLSDEALALALARRGRERVVALYDSERLLPRHIDLARAIASQPG